MTDPRELEPEPPDYEPEHDDDWELLVASNQFEHFMAAEETPDADT